MKSKFKRFKYISFILAFIFIALVFINSNSVKVMAEEDAILRVGWGNEPDSLSPFIAYNQPAAELFTLIYSPLISLDNDQNPVGVLATEWSVSDDNLTWTFKLVKNAKWHDGEIFTSEDVKFSYELMKESGLGLYSGLLDGIEEIDCPDSNTVVIKTEEPKANMLQGSAPILPKHIWSDVPSDELETWSNEKPIGTGPFKFSEWKKGEYIKIETNNDYHLDKAKIDGVVFILYANNDTLAQSLKIGEINGAININPNQLAKLESEENIMTVSAPALGFTQISINSWTDSNSKGNPLLLDNKIRQAIDLAIDKQRILDVVYSGKGTPGTTLVPPSLPYWHYQPSGEELRNYDVDRANKLLDEAGYKKNNGDGIREDFNGNPLSFIFTLRADNSEEVKSGQMIKGMLQEIGIEVKIETVDDGVLIDKIYDDANFDMFIWGWGTDTDPTTILNVMSGSQIGNLSDCNYSNPEFDKLLKKQITILDLEERQKVVFELQRMLYEDAPYSILWYEDDLQAVRTDTFKGWTRASGDGSIFFAINNYNYLNVEHIRGAATSSSVDNNKSSSTFIWIGIILVAVVVFVIFKKKNSTQNN